MNVRRYVGAAEDAAAITRMCLQLYAEDAGVREVTSADVATTLAHALAHPDRLSVLLLDDVGYALVVYVWSNELNGLIAFVDELFIVPTARGRGVATAFFTELPLLQPLVAIDLEVTPKNKRARALYERLGFKPQVYAGMRKRL